MPQLLSLILDVLGVFCCFLSPVIALSSRAEAATPKSPDDLLDEYDFIVAGAGTAGLTVADRLSESGEYTVLAVEYGYLDNSASITAAGGDQFQRGREEHGSGTRFYNITSTPDPQLRNRTRWVAAGCLVGGSSAVNGMIFDRGSAEDYDSWVDCQGEAHRDEYAAEWGWDNILPAFKKSVKFDVPSDEAAERYGFTWDVEGAYGGSTEVHSSFRPYQWPGQKIMWDAFKHIEGVTFPRDGAAGTGTGVYWMPNSIDASTEKRSYARQGHYDGDGGASTRENFHLLTGQRVKYVVMNPPTTNSSTMTNSSANGLYAAKAVVLGPREDPMPDPPQQVRARREIILSAGSIHTAQILQRSGIGPRAVLEAANVPVKIELPGVGRNMQDHMNFPIAFNFTKNVWPNDQTMLSNATFRNQSMDLWLHNRTGPLSTHVNSGAFLSLPVMAPTRFESIVTDLLAQDPAAYLPDTHPTLVAGYAEQIKTMAQQLSGDESAVIEMPFSGSGRALIVSLRSLSRGVVELSPSDDGLDPTKPGSVEPVVSYRCYSNPIDRRLSAEVLDFTRRYFNSPAMVEVFAPVEVQPGVDRVFDEASAFEWLTNVTSPSEGHHSGTAALGPVELGGVVGPGLLVHGTEGLSVADNSIVPMIPGSHTSATAYAIGEKAAEIILRRAKSAKTLHTGPKIRL